MADPKFHVAEENPDIHLQRLLAPQDLDAPFYRTIFQTVRDVVHPPKLPPLEVTSKPVDPAELKGLNGLYGGNETGAGFVSLLVHAGIVGLLLYLGSLKPLQKAVKEMATLIYTPPPMPVKPVESKGGGGGGARQPIVKQADLPKPVRQFVAPAEHFQTQLAAPVAINVDLPDIDPTAIGAQSGLNAFAGTGAGGGFGNGKGGGIGNGDGNGLGDGAGGGTGGDAYRPGGAVTFPVAISQPEPEYSDEARRARREGEVLVSLIVDARGRPIDVRVLHPLGMGLDQKAIEAVSRWRFKPGTKDGKPVPVIAQVAVRFRLL
jgi:periplasmic protein TonB